LVSEFEQITDFVHSNPNHPNLKSQSDKSLFERDELAILEFLKPSIGAGPAMIQRFRIYHDRNAGDFAREIIQLIDQGQTVILDLGNANPEVMDYFSYELSSAVFNHQVDKFSNNALGKHFVQLYFEEAHNLFPAREEGMDIYRRIAKEGAKYHIGMVYSTQSVTTINKDLLGQTENFFIAHLSSQDEVNALAKVNVAYESLKDDILQAKTVGYIRMLTRSHRFVVSVQARKFTPPDKTKGGN
jgi:DNA helicase HerA-like ATPase